MNHPKVSVILRSYNYEQYLGESIESVLQQDFDDWELIIIDDASTDGSAQIITHYAQQHPQKIVPILLTDNIGQIATARQALALCRGEYVAMLDADDIATPQRLSQGCALLDEREDVAAFFSKVQVIDGKGRPLGTEPTFNEDFKSLHWTMLDKNVLCHTSAIFRKSVVQSLGAWSPYLSATADYDLWIRLLTTHRIERIDDIWVRYRVHGANLSMNTVEGDRFNKFYETIAVTLYAVEHWPLSHLFPIHETPGTQAHREELAKIKVALARLCIVTDLRYLQVPLLGTQKAYALALEAGQLAPELDEVKALFKDVYRALGDTPRAEGERSILMRELREQQGIGQPSPDAGRIAITHKPTPLALTDMQKRLFELRVLGWSKRPVILVAIIDYGIDADAGERTRASLRQQIYPHADTLVVHCHANAAPASDDAANLFCAAEAWPHALSERLQDASADWVWIVQAGDELAENALALLAERIVDMPHELCCYTDEDSVTADGYGRDIFKPDLNLDLLRSYAYTGSSLAFQRESLLELGGLRAFGAACLQDLTFRFIEAKGLQSVGHLPQVVYHAQIGFAIWLSSPDVVNHYAQIVSQHLQRLAIAHELEPGIIPGGQRVRYLHTRQPAISIIIPTRDQLPLLNGLIDSLLARTSYKNYELLIVDNDSQEPAACSYLDGIERLNSPQLRVLRYPHPFNYSAINNFAAAQARGEYLVLLNNDTAVIQDDWIEQLLNHAQRPEVGIVGAKLHYPDGRVQHAGVVLGLRGPADHPFMGLPADANGYMHRLQVDQNYTAVTAACLMIRSSIYREVGGLDEQDFKVSYNDVDLCLKVRQAGYLTVWTPHARLMHEGNVSQNKDATAHEAKLKRFKGEQAKLYRKWLPLLARDPAYNANLNLNGPGFDLDPQRQAHWQPFVKPLAPRLFCVAADAQGCGHYRIRQPFLSMQRQGLAEGVIAEAHMTPVNMQRYAPDTIVLQRQLTNEQLGIMSAYRDFIGAFKVYELDDYLPNVPVKSPFRASMPKDVMKAIRKSVSLTDRFVVSTEPLAEQFAGLHHDIRVVHNRLPTDWWSGLESRRRISGKPRVGWGGGNSHRGDLELIADVVRDLANEVEWVFFGMCPDKLRPYVHEFHMGVPIEEYPAKLASLNLDLALAPLEENVFNACKSNLRLLEYGACGFPVVCSDSIGYRGDLPVTRVRNRYKDWMAAIRMHLSEMDATAQAGDALRQAVDRHWMLRDDNLQNWLKAWLPD